jgi:predicted neutral ceramidase superfamily lipid hydrolase
MAGNQAPPRIWIAVSCFVAFFGLIYTSSWLRGSRWFSATMLCLAGAFTLLVVEELRGGLTVKAGLLLLFFAWVFAFLFYVLGAHHVTRTRLLDLTYNSHPALVEFLQQNQVSSPLASTLRAMPIVLVTGLVIRAGPLGEEQRIAHMTSNSAPVSDACAAALRAFYSAPQRGR